MPVNERLAALREAFEAGNNPLVFIPYAAALRGERQYSQAIEVCQKGLTHHPDSVAGRTLLGRLYCDIGSYEESRTILEEARQGAPEAIGVGVALAQTYVRMREVDKAEDLVDQLKEQNPQEPEIEALSANIVSLRPQRQSGDAVAPVPASPPEGAQEKLDSIIRRVESASAVKGAVFLSLVGPFESIRRGQAQPLREAVEACREIRRACQELEMGDLAAGEFHLESGTILFACRGDELVMLCVEPSERMGPTKVVFDWAVNHVYPLAESIDTVYPEIDA